ncbi:MAG: flagellar hook-length control protein FliK [Myxococcales bacterium]|nr:flagellar hook-length control protein FliK [Myxococcales bacterium]MCB9642919.1 flagellar hook-length control protein FliK [Myxococcales bacterium]
MTRINDSQQIQQQQQAQQANKARDTQAPPQDSERAFSSRLKKQEENKQTQQPSSKESTSTAPDTSSAKARMMQNQSFSLSGRKGTVADLQAQLNGQMEGAKGKGLSGKMEGVEGSVEGKGSLEGKGDLDAKGEGLELGKEMGLEAGDMKMAMGAEGKGLEVGLGLQGQSQIQQGGNLSTSATVEVRGAKIPTAMMEKMMDQARVGVNEVGAPEFQFDLKGDVLGGMKMRISMENGQLKAIFVAENPEVRKFMDGNLKDLERNLQDRGIFIKNLEVRDPEEDRRQRQRDQAQKDRQDAMGGLSE